MIANGAERQSDSLFCPATGQHTVVTAMTWYQPEDPTPREACPCCGYVTLAVRGMCLICPVCFWEDDPCTRGAHHVYSLPNHMTLAEGRKNFATFGACDSKGLGHILPRVAALAIFERRPVDTTDPFPPREPCPCCGYVSLPSLREPWDCAVCHWIDSGEPLHVTHVVGPTLYIARARFERRGITDDRFERRPLLGGSEPMPTHPCPCCDHVTFVERGADLVCPLCAWADDANETASTIAEARARFGRGEWFEGDELVWRIDHADCALFERRPRQLTTP